MFFWLLAAAYAADRSACAGRSCCRRCWPPLGTLLLVYDLGDASAGRRAGLAGRAARGLTRSSSRRCAGRRSTRRCCSDARCRCRACSAPAARPGLAAGTSLGGLAAGLGVITKGVGFLPHAAGADLRGDAPLALAASPPFAGAACGGSRPGWLAARRSAPGSCRCSRPSHAVARRSCAAYRDEILFQQTVHALCHGLAPPRSPGATSSSRCAGAVAAVQRVAVLAGAALAATTGRRDRGDLAAAVLGARGAAVLLAEPGQARRVRAAGLACAALAASAHLDGLLARRGVRRAASCSPRCWRCPACCSPSATRRVCRRSRRCSPRRNCSRCCRCRSTASARRCCGGRGAIRARARLARRAGLPRHLLGHRRCAATECPALGRSLHGRDAGKVPAGRELGLVAYKEQFLLNLDRPSFNFGHGRWREGPQEAYDAALWLAADPQRRVLLVPEALVEPCFAAAARVEAGRTSRETWWLVSGAPQAACLAKGQPGRAIAYPAPPSG